MDDASRDDTPAILKALAAEAPVPLRLIELPTNSGEPATPMNVGIEAAAGGLIALLDHDDLMLPEKLATQAEVLESHPNLEFVLGDYDFLIENHRSPRAIAWPWEGTAGEGGDVAKTVLRLLEPSVCRRTLMTGNMLGYSCSNYVFRRSLWHRLGGFSCEAGNSTDWDFLLRASEREIGWLASVLFVRRIHAGNLWQPTARELIAALRTLERWLRLEARRMDYDTYNELRTLSVSLPMEFAWQAYWRRKWDEFDQYRQALSDYSDVPSVKKLLASTDHPRWLYPIRDFPGKIRRMFLRSWSHG